MTSPKKRSANRRNARKSTGPKTPEGKAVSARNAVRHGLLAQHIVLAEDPNENPDDFNQLLGQLWEQYKPSRPLAYLLVERLAADFWRLRRALRYETQSIRDSRESYNDEISAVYAQITGKTHDPLKIILPREADLNRLLRYETMIEREINRTLRRLEQLCPDSADPSDPPPDSNPDDGPADPPPDPDPANDPTHPPSSPDPRDTHSTPTDSPVPESLPADLATSPLPETESSEPAASASSTPAPSSSSSPCPESSLPAEPANSIPAPEISSRISSENPSPCSAPAKPLYAQAKPCLRAFVVKNVKAPNEPTAPEKCRNVSCKRELYGLVNTNLRASCQRLPARSSLPRSPRLGGPWRASKGLLPARSSLPAWAGKQGSSTSPRQ